MKFYYSIGKDLCEKQIDNKYGSKFYATLSRDLRKLLPDAEELYPQIFPQAAEELPKVPWGHHRLLIDKFSDNPPKALFFVGKIQTFTYN